ncbi:MAG: hypothetical protein AB7N65_02790 [Vicinamibacterales bacterium]
MAELSRDELHRLARLGAQARLEEIHREEAAIRQAFPELFRAASRPVRAAVARDEATAEPAPRPRRKNRMSAAMRKAVSERMRKYWAERRKSKANKPAKSSK